MSAASDFAKLFGTAAESLAAAGMRGIEDLEPKELHSNMGLACLRDFAAGEEVLRLPLQLCLTGRVEDAPSSLRPALESVASSDDKSSSASHLRLCARLWLEHLQTSSTQLASWLPVSEKAAVLRSAASAMRWSEEELARCGVLSSVLRCMEVAREETEALRTVLVQLSETHSEVCSRAPDDAEAEWLHLTCRAHSFLVPDRLSSDSPAVQCLVPLLDIAHTAGDASKSVFAELVTGTVVFSTRSALRSGDPLLCARGACPNDELAVTCGSVVADNVHQQVVLSLKFGVLRQEQLNALQELGLERFLRADDDGRAIVSVVLRRCDPFPNVAVVMSRILTGFEASPHLQKRVSPETAAMDRVWLPTLLATLKAQLQQYPLRDGQEVTPIADIAHPADIIYDSSRAVLKAALAQLLEMMKEMATRADPATAA